MILAYARTSTIEQVAGLEAQVRDLTAFGADKIFSEQVSSMGSRPELEKLFAEIGPGDTLVITKLDRLARSTIEMLGLVADLERRNIGLVVLSLGGEKLDTRSPTGKLMVTMLGAIATFERSLMLERQKEGIAKARAEGKFRGKPPTSPALKSRILAMLAAGEAVSTIIQDSGSNQSTVYRVLQEFKNKNLLPENCSYSRDRRRSGRPSASNGATDPV